jgi:hypothetical protein
MPLSVFFALRPHLLKAHDVRIYTRGGCVCLLACLPACLLACVRAAQAEASAMPARRVAQARAPAMRMNSDQRSIKARDGGWVCVEALQGAWAKPRNAGLGVLEVRDTRDRPLI